MFVPAHPQSERKRQTRKREVDQINDCFTRPSLCERRRWLSPSEIARRRKEQRKWKGRETCRTRNQRVLCVILTLGKEKEKKSERKSADEVTFSFCTNYFTDFYHEKKMWRKNTLAKAFVIYALWFMICKLCFFNIWTIWCYSVNSVFYLYILHWYCLLLINCLI